MAATSSGNTEIMQLLLNADADTEAKDNDGWTSLMYAATEGDVKAVKLLLDYGADINGHNGDGSVGWANATTPLMGAAYWGEEAVVKLLLSRGAETEVKDGNGQTALALARMQKHKAVIELLQTGQKLHRTSTANPSTNAMGVSALEAFGSILAETGNISEEAIFKYMKSLKFTSSDTPERKERGEKISAVLRIAEIIGFPDQEHPGSLLDQYDTEEVADPDDKGV